MLRKNPNPAGLQSLTLWAKGLVSGLQVVPYVEDKRLAAGVQVVPNASKLAGKAGVQVLPNAGAGPTLLFWMNTLTTCAVSFQKTEN